MVFVETKIWISDYGYDETLHGFDRARPGSASPGRPVDPAPVMLRWHLQEGRSVIPKSTKPHRIAENFEVFDVDLSDDELAAIDGLDTDQRGGREPTDITPESFGRPIPEA